MKLILPCPLVDAVNDRRATLFLGAGASKEAGLPDPTDLAEHLKIAAGRKLFSVLEGYSLDQVAQYLYHQEAYGKQWVTEHIITYIEERQKTIGRPPSLAHAAMTSTYWRSIFTTNFDRLIEIAYASCSEYVQHPLPFYAPDPQMHHHEQDVVRVFKLNGSIDEAGRRSGHELVLTFSDQQQARLRNEDFYKLLREEAINGPIIFIGFRFIHPGSNAPGSSPEFQVLKDLLRDISPAARWHYCVTPLSEDSRDVELNRSVLEDSKVQVINATFGDFMKALKEGLKSSPVAIEQRPQVRIPILGTELLISSEEFEKDRRHFEVLSSRIEQEVAPSVEASLNGEENWMSFQLGHYIDRECKNDFESALNECCETAPSMLLLGASPGWGKTFLLRSTSISRYAQGQPVFWLNPFGNMEAEGEEQRTVIISGWDASRIDQMLGLIANKAKQAGIMKNVVPIIVADDCPERVTETLSLFRTLEANKRRFVLIMAVTDVEREALELQHPLLQKAMKFLPEGNYDSRSEVRRLVDFCAEHQVGNIESTTDRKFAVQRILQDNAESPLILALQIVFDKKHRPFTKIVESLWEEAENDIERGLIKHVCALHQYGTVFAPRFFSILSTFRKTQQADVLSCYQRLMQRRILFEYISQEEPCVRTLHPLVAEKLLQVSGLKQAELDAVLIDVVKQMTGNVIDLEILRRLLKRINDYKIYLADEETTRELFETSARATNNDWVVCQQYAKYLLKREEPELASAWVDHALEYNSKYSPLHHTKGNVLRKWGMELLRQGKKQEAEKKFEEARIFFANSRIGREPDEYGYVTHLDMILALREQEHDDTRVAVLTAEGVKLYREGLHSVPEDRYNWLLFDKYRKNFDIYGQETRELSERIVQAVEDGRASDPAAVFLADYFCGYAAYPEALDILQKQREKSQRLTLWVKEAEVHARRGDFHEASRSIDLAKRRQSAATNWEELWALWYWDLLIAIPQENYEEAREAVSLLKSNGFFARQRFPRGYFWKRETRDIPASKRTFEKHAKIWSGRVANVRAGGAFGHIAIENAAGDRYYVEFTKRYFGRMDVRKGDNMRFVIEILPCGLRAANQHSKPFEHTSDDLFV